MALSASARSGDVAERAFVWAHLAFIFGFLAYLPHSKHLHIATAAVNVYFSRTGRRGRLEPLRFDLPDDEIRFGAGTKRKLIQSLMIGTPSVTTSVGTEALNLDHEKRAWKNVWSAGQGVGSIDDVPTTAELCARLVREYRDAMREAADESAEAVAA